MKRIFLFLFLLGALLSCTPPGRVIPKEKLAEIYADMFVADQWVAEHHLRSALDTASLYGAVLERYGYTVEDYRVTAKEYLKDPERYAKIIKKTMKILEQREKDLKAEIQRQDEIKDKNKEIEALGAQYLDLFESLIRHLSEPRVLSIDTLNFPAWYLFNEYKITPIIENGKTETVPVPDGPDEP